MSVIRAIVEVLNNSAFFEYLFDDFIGFAVLCVACVLMLSYLREQPPEFEKKRIFGAGAVLFAGAFASRSLAHYSSKVLASPSKYGSIFLNNIDHSPSEELLHTFSSDFLIKVFGKINEAPDVARAGSDDYLKSALTNLLFKGFHFENFEYERYILIINVITTLIGFVSICTGAFILMRMFRAKHITPMAVVQIAGFLVTKIARYPYETFVKSLPGVTENVKLCGYSGFAYGCFMIIMIILYLIITKHRYASFWTKNIKVVRHILSLFILFLVYTVLTYEYSNIISQSLKDNNSGTRFGLYSFEILIYIFLAAGLLYVPKRTYTITRMELQDDFYAEKRDKEVEKYSYSELRIRAERKYMHDLPGHFRAIASMADKRGADEISQYVQELDKKLIKSKGEFSSGNAFLDDFLYDKQKKAQQSNIDIVFSGVFPNKGIRRIDITTVFHNLIENAIEASKNVSGKRKIVIISKIHEDRVYISFANTFEQKVRKKQGKYETSKKNKAFHGYGLSSVESVVKKREYDGTFSTRQEGNIFIAEVNMKFKR